MSVAASRTVIPRTAGNRIAPSNDSTGAVRGDGAGPRIRPPRARLCLALVLAGASASCRGYAGELHPNAEHRAPPEGQIWRIPRRGSPESLSDPRLQAAAHRLTMLHEVGRIGALGGDETQLLGDIEDVAIDPRGQVVVLDRQSERVRVYDIGGDFLHDVGRPGSGPGEFDDPRALTVDEEGTLWVADWPDLQWFAPDDSAGFTYVGSAQPNLWVWHMCALDGRLYVSGMRLGAYYGRDTSTAFPPVIQVVDADGVRLAGFGRVYRSPNRLIQENMLIGAGTCLPNHALIVYAPDDLGEIRAWSPVGEPAWTTDLIDFNPLYWEETEDRGDQPHFEKPWETVRALTVFPPDHILVQTGFRNDSIRNAGGGDLRLDTYIIDAATGRGAYLGSDIPLLVLIDDSIAIGKQSVPFPQLHIYDFTGRQEDP